MDTGTPEITTPTKESLEQKKLLLEVAELERAWWKKPTYIAALFPTLLALTALIYGIANGYFQATSERIRAENIKLENQKHDLQKEIDAFTLRKTVLEKENTDLTNQNISLSFQKDAFLRRIRTVTNNLSMYFHEKNHALEIEKESEQEKILRQQLLNLYNALKEFDKDELDTTHEPFFHQPGHDDERDKN
jgi:stress-induced morphogen